MCLTDGRRAEDFNRFQHYIWLYVVGLFVVGSSEYLYRRTGWGPQVVLPPFVGVDRLSSVTRCHIALHRVMAAAELPCDPLGTPAQRLQPHHRRHIVRRFHHLPPQNLVLQGASRDSSLVHSLSPQASEEGAIPRDAEGAIFHGARQAGPREESKTRVRSTSQSPLVLERPFSAAFLAEPMLCISSVSPVPWSNRRKEPRRWNEASRLFDSASEASRVPGQSRPPEV